MRLGPRPRPVRTDLPPQFHVTVHEDQSMTVEQHLAPEAIASDKTRDFVDARIDLPLDDSEVR